MMNEKLKHKIKFVLVDTGYWILTLLALIASLFVVATFLLWDVWAFELLWEIKWLMLRIIAIMSLLLALLGGWSSNYRH